MKIYIVSCAFNNSQSLIDAAFKTLKEAKAYATELNGDKDKAGHPLQGADCPAGQ